MNLGLMIAEKMLDENLTKIDSKELSVFINEIISSLPEPVNKITNRERSGELNILCSITSAGYDTLSHSENRISTMQNNLQKHFDALQYADKEQIRVDTIEVGYLSMKHVWRNSIL